MSTYFLITSLLFLALGLFVVIHPIGADRGLSWLSRRGLATPRKDDAPPRTTRLRVAGGVIAALAVAGVVNALTSSM